MAADERLHRLLGGEALAMLRRRLRQRHERVAPGDAPPPFRLDRLTHAEHAALAALQGRPTRFAPSMQVDVAAIDALLREAGVAATLRNALEALDGEIFDRRGERDAAQARWHALVAACEHPALATWLEAPAAVGLLKRLAAQEPVKASRALAQAAAVLHELPARGLTRAQLAAAVLGDAHALDAGRAASTLVLALLRTASTRALDGVVAEDGEDAERSGLSARELWAGAGVLVNELARPALVLNLPGVGDAGEPTYLSLRRLLRSPPQWRLTDITVFVCENPNLLAIAADHLGARCAPLVCTEGMPAAAQRSLLTQLGQAGAALRYHGDFDWPGLQIGNHLMRQHDATAWRFGTADYTAALSDAPRHGRVLGLGMVEAAWDAALATTMREADRAIDEELVAASLLADLVEPARPLR